MGSGERGCGRKWQEEWNQLRRIYWELKQYWTEHSDLEQVEVSFPPEVLAGTMVAYFDIFPFARRLEFTHEQETWVIDDQYCCNPKCPCQEAVLSFIRPSPGSGAGPPPADSVDLLPISRRQSQSARCRKERSVFRTRFVGIVEKSPCRLRFAVGQAAVTAEAVVWPRLENADNSVAYAQNRSQRPLPLRQWQEVEKMLRSLI